jgi:Uncharacterized protein (competence- and mitomycin-induced)
VSITGIAGPDGGSLAKPVGTVCFAVLLNNQESTTTQHFSGDREAVRWQSVKFALKAMRGALATL